ncbi:hypothetical protein Dsin_002089 [Dipteronia sinensis]|uniref:Pectinesterase inhibitor domain-containing protein n=1 Tax=Dipteronia sinensis TaxID=43782 RepID=A0AAE0B603_9ROSI|nr:hypothetical protein Dsin_002089 [Dipteronia sinensis]
MQTNTRNNGFFLNDWMMLMALFLSLSLYSASPAPAPAPTPTSLSNNLVESTCNKTCDELYTLCMEILESNPETASASSPLDLAKAALNLAVEDTQVASEKLRVLLKTKITQPELSELFDICVNWYDMAVGQFSMSSKEVDEDPETANYDADLANSHESSDCESALASAGIHLPQIEAMIKRLECFCRIAYIVTDALPQEF